MDPGRTRRAQLHQPSRPADVFRVLSMAVGLGVVLLWAWTAYSGQAAWSFWIDGVVAGLAFIAVALFQTGELFAVPLFAVDAGVLLMVAFFGGSTGFSRWLVAWHLVAAASFLALIPLSVALHDPVSEVHADDAARA